MSNFRIGKNIAIFVLFFGVAVIEAAQTQNWIMVIFWIAISLVFLWGDRRNANK